MELDCSNDHLQFFCRRVDPTDLFSRKMSVYLRGQVANLIIAWLQVNPFSISTADLPPDPISRDNATFAPTHWCLMFRWWAPAMTVCTIKWMYSTWESIGLSRGTTVKLPLTIRRLFDIAARTDPCWRFWQYYLYIQFLFYDKHLV